MRKLILLVSAAAMAAAMPALAQGRGGGNGKGGDAQAEARGGGHQGHGRGNGRAERGPEVRQAANRGGGHARRTERREVRGVERADRRIERQVRGNDRRDVREVRRPEGRDWGHWASGRGEGQRFAGRGVNWRDGRSLPVRLARGGCPPGLAKQNAFCLPPGQLRRAQMMGQRIDRSRFGAVPQDWLYRFRDNDDFYYRYDDAGYIYRMNRENDLVSAILPLFGTGLTLGEPLPLGYDAYNLPVPYRDRYADSDDHLYRYDNGAIYQVDTQTRLIQGVVALLTGNPISVGSALPSGYDAYNLPMSYRDRYADDADSMYRYSNGGIYQVDPTTMLVQSLVEMVL